MRVMLDTNCIDELLADGEAFSALQNCRSIRLLISEVQIGELSAIPDAGRREALLEIARSLCSRIAAPALSDGEDTPDAKHLHDRVILQASARCDLLVSNDLGMQEAAYAKKQRCLDWKSFLRKFVYTLK